MIEEMGCTGNKSGLKAGESSMWCMYCQSDDMIRILLSVCRLQPVLGGNSEGEKPSYRVPTVWSRFPAQNGCLHHTLLLSDLLGPGIF